jgi:hypothetical protein
MKTVKGTVINEGTKTISSNHDAQNTRAIRYLGSAKVKGFETYFFLSSPTTRLKREPFLQNESSGETMPIFGLCLCCHLK